MADLGVSLALLAVIVVSCEAARRAARRLCSGDYRLYLVEAASTFQLCACTHELKLLGEVGRVESRVGLTLTYIMTIIHVSTFCGASCNPTGVLENMYRGTTSVKSTAVVLSTQFAAAIVAQLLSARVWTLGLSELHVTHQKFGYRCLDPINATLVEAAAAESACAFVIHTAVMHIHKLDERFKVHAVAAVITFLVYTGGNISGAVFNPALALSIQFPCGGHTYPEYCFVYWLGPVLGMTCCLLLFGKIIPFFSRKSTIRLDVSIAQKKKTH